MPTLIQFCLVIVTIAVVAVAAVGLRLMLQTRNLIESANRSLIQLPSLIEDAKRASARTEELLAAFSRITRSAEVGVSSFESVAMRSTGLAARLLDEVEVPVAQAVGVMRGIRTGVEFLAERLKSRAHARSITNQGEDHVGE